MRLTAEACSQISITDLQKKVRNILHRDYPEHAPEEFFNLMYNEMRKFSVNGQTFDFTGQPNHLGGYRWYFTCPRCKKNANKLVLPPETVKDREHLYLCKTCHGIRNRTTRIGHSTLYQKITKPLKRMKQIQDKIAVGHLTLDKTQQLLDEHDAIERQLRASPEYRLFVFKKKHKMLG